MKKHLKKMLLIAAIWAVPWVTQGQALLDYHLTVDTTTFNSIRTTGTAMTFSSTDDGYSTITLPFAIGYGESSFPAGTSIACSANGFISIGSASVSGTTATYSNSTNCYITAILQQDAHIGRYSESGAYYQYNADSGTFTIEYHLLGAYSSPYGAYSYQIVFHTNSTIEIIYDTADLGGASSRTFATYLTDGPNGDRLYLSGSWDNPTISSSYSTRPYSTLPAQGLRYTFSRPTVTCPKPVIITLVPDSLTVNSAFFTWTDTTESTEWLVRLGNAAPISVYDTSYGIYTLTPDTYYSFAVATVCSPGDTSAWRTIDFHTPCADLTVLPWTQSFEYASSGSSSDIDFGVDCMNRLTDATSYYYPYVGGSSYAHTGSKGLYWYNYSYSTYGMYKCIVLPSVDTSLYPVNSLLLSFWAKNSSTSYSPVLEVGVLTNPNDYSTFQSVGYVSLSSMLAWNQYLFYMDSYTGSGKYIAIRGNADSWTLYLDDISLDIIPDCPRVENISVSGITTNSANISWNESGNATSWEIEYVPTGLPSDSAVVVTVTDSNYTFTDLQSNTEYTVSIAPVCTGTVGVNSITFRTECDPFEELPYSYGFEDVSTTFSSSDIMFGIEANCWRRVTDANAYHYPYIGGSSYAHSGSKGLYWYNYPSNDNGNYKYVVLPEFDSALHPTNTLQLRLWARSSSTSYYPYLYVGVMTDIENPNSFVPVDTVEVGNSAVWHEYDVSLAGYTGAHGRIAVTFPYLNNSSSYVYLDDFTVEEAPACARPDYVSIAAVDNESVALDWVAPDAGATQWKLVYGVAGFDPDSVGADEVYATSHPVTLTGLNPGTAYDVYLYTVCDNDDLSYSRPFSFRTACTPIDTLPYFYGFEGTTASSSGTIDPCWVKGVINSTTAYPYPNSVHFSGTRSLYFYGYYTSNVKSWAVLPMFNDSLDELQVSFKLRAYNLSYEYYGNSITVGVMQNPYDISTFTPITRCEATSTTTWDSFSVLLYGHQADGRYIAFVSQGLNSTVYYNYAYLDDVVVDYAPNCGPVTNVASACGATSALITWEPSVRGESTGATIEYRDASDPSGDWTTVVVSDNMLTLTSLTPSTHYEMRIYNECVDGTAPAIEYAFNTHGYPCTTPDTTITVADTVGHGTSTNNYIPSYSFYGNGLSQQIYLAEELGGLGQITGMKLHTQAHAQVRNWTIYLAHTEEVSVDSWIVPSEMTEVWSGSVTYQNIGWVDFDFTTPFNYDGSSNLLVFVDDHTGSYVSGNYNYSYVHSLPSGRVSRYIYRDGTAYDPYNPGGAGAGSALTVRCNMIFTGYGCGSYTTCSAPPAMITEVGAHDATAVWVPGADETSWVILYKEISSSTWTSLGEVYSTSYTFSGLSGGTEYNVKIGAVCGLDTLFSNLRFTTICTAIDSLPFFEDFNTWGDGTSVHAPDCWAYGSDYSNAYPYIYSYYNHSGTTGGSMYMYNYNGSNPNSLTYFSLPAVDTSVARIRDLQVCFYTMTSTTSYIHNLVVGVSVDPYDMSTFVPVDTVVAHYGDWDFYEVSFDRYTDSGTYITFAASVAPGYSYSYPYVDDITLERIPDCQRPNNLQASNPTTTTIDLSWNSRTESTEFIIEYGRFGFTPGTGTAIVVNTNPYTLTLPAGYQGEYYVRNICGEGDTSDYSRDACRFTLHQIPATVPYSFNFEDAAEWNTWQINSNNSINWYRGTAVPAYDSNYCMYISTDYGATFGTDMTTIVNAATWRDIDFGPTPTSFEITFQYKAGASTDNSYDGLMVFLVDTGIAVEASTSGITSPWGNVNDLYRIFSGRLDTAWTSARAIFDTVSGVKRVAFFWFNQNTASSHPWIFGPAAVDDIHIYQANCPRPVNMTVDESSITTSTATLHWNGLSGSQYRVAYRVAGAPASTNQYVDVTTNSVTLTGLSELTNYYAWVQNLCTEDSSLFSDGVEFQTAVCDNVEYAYSYPASASPTTSTYGPIGYSTYNYSYVQTLIDSAQFAGLSSGEIVGFAFNPTVTTAGDYFNHMTVYMANVPESNLSAGWIMPDTHNHVFVKVIDNGDFRYEATGWLIQGFDTTFTWDGHSNVLFAVNREHGSWVSGATFSAHSTSDIRTRYVYQDGSAYNPFDASSISSGYTLNLVGDIRFFSCPAPRCAQPVITSVTQDYHSATITWTGDGDNYQVNIKESSVSDWPVTDIIVSGNTYTFTGLTPATNYTFRVRQDCTVDSLGYSDWVEEGFLTDSLPCFTPDSLHAISVTNATATLDWNVIGTETAWDIHVWFAGFDSVYRVTSRPATVGGFIAGVTYNAAIRPLCGVDLLEGDWSDTVTFATAICPNVTGLTAGNITANSITLNWTADPMAQSWVIEYGYYGFDQGTGITVTTTTNNYVFNGLEDETDYDFYVKAVCGTEWLSENWANVNATTLSGGVTCDAPTNVSTTVADNSVTVNWTAGEGNNTFELEYGPHGFSHNAGTIVSANASPATISNLDYETQYDIYVRALCDQNTYSAWSVVATFTTGEQPSEDCDPVTSLNVTEITETTATVTWTPGATGDHWQVVVSDATGSTVSDATVSEPRANLTGLTRRTNYTVSVRTDCGDGNYSAYVTANFRTEGEGIDDVTSATCTIYPNPTSSSTTITVSGVNGKVKIAVVDMNGRTVATETLECNSDCAKTMDVDNLAQGAYFVRITGDSVNMVKKLIVR